MEEASNMILKYATYHYVGGRGSKEQINSQTSLDKGLQRLFTSNASVAYSKH